jgi:hypothetical protein
MLAEERAAMSADAVVTRPAWPPVVTGAVIGLTWAAALRGWMVQMAADESAVHWYGTFALVLAPGLFAGALIGLAEHRRRTGASRSRWLILSPCLFLAALADPAIFKALITNGEGGGAIGVVLVGLAGGYALSGRGRAWWRRTCGVFAVLSVLLMLVMASDTAPLETAHGAWVGLYAASLVAALCLACAIPQRIGQPSLVPAAWIAVAVGALCGFAWAAALRALMWEVAGDDAGADWVGTFLWVLLPGTSSAHCWRWPSTGGGPVPCHTGAGLSGRRCCSRPSSCTTPSTWRAASRAASVSQPSLSPRSACSAATRSPAAGRAGSEACATWSRCQRSRSGH